MKKLLLLLLVVGCKREERSFPSAPDPGTGYQETAQAVSDGQQLFSAFNCVGCHSHGGGGMGPALMDDRWIYGSDPDSIYQTISEGRPNGMPAFADRIAPAQRWELVAYVRSLGGLVRRDATSARTDEMSSTPSPATRDPVTPEPEQAQHPQ